MNAQRPSNESRKPLWRRGIGPRLILYITLFSSVVTLLGTAVQLYFEYQRDMASIKSNLRQIEVSYVKSISEGVWSFNDRILKTQLEGILDLPDIVYIEISNGEKPIMTAGKLTASKSVEHIFPLKYQHRDTVQQLGTLRVVVGLNGVYQRLQQRVIVILLTQGVKTFLVSMFIFYLFYMLVGRHLTTMAGYVRSLKPDALSDVLIIPRTGRHNEEDELGIVIRAINDMRASLQQAFNKQNQTEQKLSTAYAELEMRVAERTSELFIVNAALKTEIAEHTQAEEALQEKNTELDRFAYTVSHDLKSPLITIQAYAGMIKKDLKTGKYERAQDDMQRIEGAADKMTSLLNDLLKLSRAGRMMGEPSLIDMNRLVSDVLAQLTGVVTQSLVEIVVQPDLPAVHGDPKRIAEVVQNLIENAIKYRSDLTVPRIEIGTRQDGWECVFFVKDNGKGIDPRHFEKVFGLFNKLDAESAGTGVGLALVKRIIEVHGGQVWVESEGEGKGSRFCFTVGS